MSKRRNRNEICAQLQKDRKKIYSQRSRLINKQKSGNLKPKEYDKINSKIGKLSSKIDSYKPKIFKCGKRYANLKKSRTSLVRKINVLKNSLKKDRSISVTARNKILLEIQSIGSDVRDLSVLMGMNLYEQGKGRLSYLSDVSTMESVEVVVIWEAKSKVEGLIQYNEFDTLIVGEKSYDLIIDRVSAMFSLDDYLAEISASQHSGKVRTPMVTITMSPITRSVSIK